jgi:hypothetical protein
MLVEKRLASFDETETPERLLASLDDDESVGGRLVEELGDLAVDGVAGLGSSDFFPRDRDRDAGGATCVRHE